MIDHGTTLFVFLLSVGFESIPLLVRRATGRWLAFEETFLTILISIAALATSISRVVIDITTTEGTQEYVGGMCIEEEMLERRKADSDAICRVNVESASEEGLHSDSIE